MLQQVSCLRFYILNHDEDLKSLKKEVELSEIVSVCKYLADGTAGELIKQFMNMSSMAVPTNVS